MLVNTNYIIKWVEKSETEEDNFDKFVYGFFALNALYSEFYENNERQAIKTLFDRCFDSYRSEFSKIMSLPEYQYFIDRGPIKNMRYDPSTGFGSPSTERDTRALEERILRKSNRAMLMILYQIRCNLFHGNKAYGNSSDQEIMKNAAELLLRYNKIFCKCISQL